MRALRVRAEYVNRGGVIYRDGDVQVWIDSFKDSPRVGLFRPWGSLVMSQEDWATLRALLMFAIHHGWRDHIQIEDEGVVPF